MAQADIKHIYNRFAFGIAPEEFERVSQMSRNQVLDKLLYDSKSINKLPRLNLLKARPGIAVINDPQKRQEALKQSRRNILKIGSHWLELMVESKTQLRERMTLFWHSHFASTSTIDKMVATQHDTIRRHALGSFRDMLHAMCKDAMLLQYLNNDQNRKQKPNENFARELLELFTLGEGNYVEFDIKEAARAFTGHHIDREGNYVFRAFNHDYGWKNFMGKEGQFDAPEIVDIILENPETAQFIVRKILRYFVHESIDESHVYTLSESFYASDYDISALISEIILADWFYDSTYVGTKIKSPIDLLVGLFRQCKVKVKDDIILVQVLQVLGQLPFYPPNVSGWPIGKQWIDGSSLLVRMRIPDFLLLGKQLEIRAKETLDMQSFFEDEIEKKGKYASFDLDGLRTIAGSGSQMEQLQRLTDYILIAQPNLDDIATLKWIETDYNISELVLFNLFRLPEYQLC